MYCTNCGKPISQETEFCKNCGTGVQNGQNGFDTSQVLNQPNPIGEKFSNVDPEVHNNPYQNQMNTNFSPSGSQISTNIINKKRANPLIIAGIIIIAIILLTAFVYGAPVILKSIAGNLGEKNELVLHDLKVEYPIGWMKESNDDSETESIEKGGVRMALNYTESNVYYSSYSAANEFIIAYEKSWDSFDIVDEIQDVTINSIEWKRIEFSGMLNGESRKAIQMVHSTGYEIYSIIYVSGEKNYDKYLDEINKIIDSAYLPSKETNAQTVKEKILGEWDCGDTGYLVINSDKTYYFYMDSSKSMDNVVSGTYEATDGIATNAAGYAEGITFITTIKKITVDGIDQPSAVDGKIQYAFEPDGTGNFDGSNLNTGRSFKMTKVR